MAGASGDHFAAPGAGRAAELWRPLVAWPLALAVAAWTLMRLLGLDRGYPLVPIVAFTPYAAAASVLALAVIAALRVRAAFAIAAIAVLVLATLILPRAFAGGQVDEPEDGIAVTVMTANLHFGDADADRVVELVRTAGVDILAVQELTPGAVRSLRAAGLERVLVEALTATGKTAGGGGIYATEPLTPASDLGRGTGGFRMPSARLGIDGRALFVVSVHPVPPTAADGISRWRAALDALPATGDGEELGLLLGDFNATLDHREMREVLDRGYVDAADVTGDALATTWSNGPWPPLTIDHLVVDRRVHVAATEIHELPGSDHKVVIADLVLPAAAD